mgnify:CR=1 FL=1
MKQLIELGCPPDGTVFDPCAGSFSVAIAAEKCGRNSISFEMNPEYFEAAFPRMLSNNVSPIILPQVTEQ